MDPFEPHVRRRGYFLSEAGDSDVAELGESESAEGITYRIRIVRPQVKQVAGGVTRRISRSSLSGGRHPSSQAPVRTRRQHTGEVRSVTATDSRRSARTPR